MYQIYEDRFLLEEGVYWRYTTDEKINIEKICKLFKLFFNDYLIVYANKDIKIFLANNTSTYFYELLRIHEF